MPYTTPYTFVALQILTAAQLNAVQANIAALWPYTAAGDLPYASAANTLAVLAKGTAGQVLKQGAADAPEWAAGMPYGVQVNAASPLAVSSALYYLPWTSEVFDDDAMHDSSTNNSRLTCKKDGRYLVMFNSSAIASTGSTPGDVHARIIKNRTTVLAVVQYSYAAEHPMTANLAAYVDMVVDDYVEIQIAGAGSGISFTVSTPVFSMILDG